MKYKIKPLSYFKGLLKETKIKHTKKDFENAWLERYDRYLKQNKETSKRS